MPIEELNFSLRTHNCLRRAGIDTVEQLSKMSDDVLMKIRNFGPKCLAEVRTKIAPPRKTNADHIRAMSDVELAEVLLNDGDFTFGSAKAALNWLQQPAEEDA